MRLGLKITIFSKGLVRALWISGKRARKATAGTGIGLDLDPWRRVEH